MAKNILSHHGVVGMKWGRRKGGGANSVPKRTQPHEDRTSVDALKRNPKKTLSNSEIEKINKRLQLEKTLSSLKTDDAQRSVKSGKGWIDLAVGTAGSVGALYGLSQTKMGQKIVQGALSAIKK